MDPESVGAQAVRANARNFGSAPQNEGSLCWLMLQGPPALAQRALSKVGERAQREIVREDFLVGDGGILY